MAVKTYVVSYCIEYLLFSMRWKLDSILYAEGAIITRLLGIASHIFVVWVIVCSLVCDLYPLR